MSDLDSNGHHVIRVTRLVKVSADRVDFRVSPRVSDGTTRLYVEEHGRRGGCTSIGVILTDEKRRDLIAVLTAQEPSGEDRSEPTPAPREPRVWRHGVHKDIDQDVNEVAGTATGRRWKRMPDKQFVWMSSGCAYSAGTVLYVEDEVVEVVTPEGTS